MGKKKIKETDEDKCLKVLIGDGQPSKKSMCNVLKSLKEIRGDKTFNVINEALHKGLFLDWDTQYMAIEIIYFFGGEKIAIDMLLNILKKEKNNSVKQNILDFFIYIRMDLTDYEMMLDIFLTLLKKEKNNLIREKFIFSIYNIQIDLVEYEKQINISQQQQIVSYLCELLNEKNQDTDYNVRIATIDTLEKFKCEQSINALKIALSDEDKNIREAAKKSLK